MIVEIVDKLIDRCLQLLKHRQVQNQELYTDFVVPALSSFEELHKNYMESFRGYRELIESSKAPLDLSHPIFEKIEQDMLLFFELRAKTVTLSNFEQDPVVGSFVRAIIIYVLGQEKYNSAMEKGVYSPPVNMARFQVIHGLKRIFETEESDEQKKRKALVTIDQLTRDRQGEYFGVIMEHSRLKAKLLNPTLNAGN